MIAPLAPVLIATVIGIVADRWFLALETKTWITIALVLGVIAILTNRHVRVCNLAVLVAYAMLGGGWHHYRWSDMNADDLAWTVTETPRPAWVRGIVREARGLRHQRPGFGFGSGEQEKVTTRFVVDLTSISDGQRWHKATGRAMVVVTGDRSLIRAGQAVEVAGQISTLSPPLNPGEFDYRAFLQAQGIRLRISVDDPESFLPDASADNWAFTFWLDSHRHRIRTWLFEQLDPSTAPLAAALLLGWRDEIDPEVNDAFARTGTTHLLAVSGLQLQALAVALLLVFRVIGFTPTARVLDRRSDDARLRAPGRTCTVCRALDRHDADLLFGRFGPASRTAGQHALAGRPVDSAHQPDVPFRRRVPALLPGDRHACVADGARVRAGSTRFRGDACQILRSAHAARRSRTVVGTAVAKSTAAGGSWYRRRNRGFDGRLVGGVAAGRDSVSSPVTDRDPLEYTAHPVDVGSHVAGGAVPRLVGGLGPARDVRWR